MEIAGMPGVAAVRDGRIPYRCSYGVANLEKGASVTGDSLWVAASLDKPVIALARTTNTCLSIRDDELF